MNRKHQQGIYHADIYVDLMEENVIQFICEITINVDVSVKNVTYEKKIMFEILPHVAVKMEKDQQVLWVIQRLHVMKLQNHTMKMWKLSRTRKKKLMKRK